MSGANDGIALGLGGMLPPGLGVLVAGVAVAAALGLLALAAALILLRRIGRAERELARVRDELGQAAGALTRSLKTEQRQRELLARLTDRLGRLELRGDFGYEQAIRFASRGERAERLVSYFGLTEGEAALVSLLHGERGESGDEPSRSSYPS